MSAVLAGRRVLVPVTQGRRDLAEALRREGAEVVEAECIVIAPAEHSELLAAAVDRWRAGTYAALAVTSRNAVLAMRDAAGGQGLERPGAVIAAVGVATTRSCLEVGLTPTLEPEREDASGIVAAFPPGPGRVLAPLGNLASPVLERGLAAKGWDVDVIEAYRTLDGPGVSDEAVSDLVSGRFDAILLTSASVAQRIRADLGEAAIPASTAIIAIGPTTAAAAKRARLAPTAISARASHDGILETLISIVEEPR